MIWWWGGFLCCALIADRLVFLATWTGPFLPVWHSCSKLLRPLLWYSCWQEAWWFICLADSGLGRTLWSNPASAGPVRSPRAPDSAAASVAQAGPPGSSVGHFLVSPAAISNGSFGEMAAMNQRGSLLSLLLSRCCRSGPFHRMRICSCRYAP